MTEHSATMSRQSWAPTGNRSLARVAIRMVIGLGVLGFVASRADVSDLGTVWHARTAAAVGGATILLVAAQVYSAIRWRTILGDESPPWYYLFRLYLVGQFFSLFLPSSIGGDAVRIVALSKATARPAEGVASVLLDRIFGVGALGTYLVIGAAIARTSLPGIVSKVTLDTRAVAGIIGAIAAVGMVISIVIIFRRRLDRARRSLAGSWAVVNRLAGAPVAIVRIVGLALLVQAIYIVAWAVLARGLGVDVPLSYFLFAVPAVSLVAMVPITFSGLGLREGMWALLLAPFGVPAAHAVALGLLYFLAYAIVGALGGLWFALRGTAPGRPVVPWPVVNRTRPDGRITEREGV